ncbi:AMP-binding protein [Thermoleophilia bacterium SCSIO 60948]|nr:AMP-binding protein [Thermoleophilia bacterium SCSIO 60948]
MVEGGAEGAGAAAIDWLRARRLSSPERVALLGADGRALTYGELDVAADRAATALRSEGAEPGRPVSMALEPGVDAIVALHGAVRLGATARMLRAGERPDDAGEPLVSSAEQLRAAVDPGPGAPTVSAGTGLSLIRTSGTSGVPKWVELSRGNHFASAVGSAFNLGVDPADRWLCCLPLNHVGGLTIAIRSTIYGTAALIHPRFETDRVAAALDGDGVTIVSLVATQLRRLLDAGAAVDRPRVILLGGGPAPPELIAEALERGARVVQSYGLTEACSQVTTLAAADAARRIGSSGRPLLTTRVEVDPGGEILVSGPTVAGGSLAADGRLHTGDLGELDEAGFLWVRDRISDLIVSGGENVLPAEVEAALASHPSVADAAVIGLPDREWQEAVSAFVVAAGEPVPERELLEFAAGRLARHELPKRITWVDELPRGAGGKLRRRELRDRYAPGG